ncbi:amidohydrolase family protein [Intrasporangium sp. DVR]|uniref:amidohydrolase family protein n=1 Tax=Intrasporangium sp. DVR TaxID=3127867 RepID=UPI00313A69ED
MHVIRARQVFDGRQFRGAADLVLDGPNVVGVRTPSEYASAVVVEDLGDVTILPGLVDAHQHLTWDCSPDPVAWHTEHDDRQLLEQGRSNARRALAAGVTTVRDLGSRGRTALDLREETARSATAGPTILVAGPALTTPGGHCWFLGGECADAADLVRAVARLDEAGVDVIKVMATGGTITPGSAPHESQFGAAALTAVVEAAHAAGLPVAAHAHGTGGVADAVTAGVDTIEHCSFFTAGGVAADPELVRRLAGSATIASLTGGTVPGAPLLPAIAARLPALLAHIRALRDAGVRCILSTDAGIGPNKPPDVLPLAIAQAVQLVGIPIADALAMCTSLAADAIGVGSRAGRLGPGVSADALVVAGRLDHDPSALARPVRVLRGGVPVPSP